MKILQVIPYFVPAYGYGGPLKVCFDLSKELLVHGHEITVATTDALDEKNRIQKLEEEIDGIKIIRFRNISNWIAKNCNGYIPFGFYFWAKNNIPKFNAIHCHDFFTLQNIIISHFCKKYDVPFIIQPHGTLSPIRQEANFNFAKKTFTKLFNGVLKNSKNIIALTENEKNDIIQIDPTLAKKIKVVPNGIRLEEFENIEKIDLHERYGIPQKNKVIGYIGRIQHIKGIDISLEILAKLKNKILFTYLIIGPNEGEKEVLEKKIEELGLKKNVIFAGILIGKEKLATIKSCDVFLFTSRNEGFPMTILEVAAMGVPQILSKNCNVPEIKEYGGGFEFDLKNKQEFVEKIKLVLTNLRIASELGRKAHLLVKNNFNLIEIVKKIQKIYKKII